MFHARLAALAAFLAITITAANAHALVAYGVTSNGDLFSFDPLNSGTTANTTTIGNIGFVPEGIDFRPATGQLYAVNIDLNNITTYTLNVNTAAPTFVGAFSTPIAFNGSVATAFGMDFNPMVDRLRLVSNAGGNIRVNPADGSLVSSDTALAYAAGDVNVNATPKVSAVAYANNLAAAPFTTLFFLDPNHDLLGTINPPNNGTLNTVGINGVTVDFGISMGFDIYTDPNTLSNTAYAVGTRSGVAGGAYMLYDVNLATGSTTGGRLVGGGLDFTGGFAVTAPVPEPASLALLGAGGLLLLRRRK